MPSSELTADPLQRNTNKTSSGNLTEKDKDRPRDNMQSDARVPYVFSSVPPWAQTSSAGAKSPLCSTWNEKSAPQARLEKKPIQNRAVHKSLAHVDRGRRLPGAEQQHTRQTDRQAACPPRLSLMKNPVLVRSTAHRNKSLQATKQRPSRSNCDWEKTHNLTERISCCIYTNV